jgi:hypothetical protein
MFDDWTIRALGRLQLLGQGLDNPSLLGIGRPSIACKQ